MRVGVRRDIGSAKSSDHGLAVYVKGPSVLFRGLILHPYKFSETLERWDE